MTPLRCYGWWVLPFFLSAGELPKELVNLVNLIHFNVDGNSIGGALDNFAAWRHCYVENASARTRRRARLCYVRRFWNPPRSKQWPILEQRGPSDQDSAACPAVTPLIDPVWDLVMHTLDRFEDDTRARQVQRWLKNDCDLSRVTKQLFDSVDTDGTGNVGRKELQKCLEDFCEPRDVVNKESLSLPRLKVDDEVLRKRDTSEDGKLKLKAEEFHSLVRAMLEQIRARHQAARQPGLPTATPLADSPVRAQQVDTEDAECDAARAAVLALQLLERCVSNADSEASACGLASGAFRFSASAGGNVRWPEGSQVVVVRELPMSRDEDSEHRIVIHSGRIVPADPSGSQSQMKGGEMPRTVQVQLHNGESLKRVYFDAESAKSVGGGLSMNAIRQRIIDFEKPLNTSDRDHAMLRELRMGTADGIALAPRPEAISLNENNVLDLCTKPDLLARIERIVEHQRSSPDGVEDTVDANGSEHERRMFMFEQQVGKFTFCFMGSLAEAIGNSAQARHSKTIDMLAELCKLGVSKLEYAKRETSEPGERSKARVVPAPLFRAVRNVLVLVFAKPNDNTDRSASRGLLIWFLGEHTPAADQATVTAPTPPPRGMPATLVGRPL